MGGELIYEGLLLRVPPYHGEKLQPRGGELTCLKIIFTLLQSIQNVLCNHGFLDKNYERLLLIIDSK